MIRRIIVLLLLLTMFGVSLVVFVATAFSGKAHHYHGGLRADEATKALQEQGWLVGSADVVEVSWTIFRHTHDSSDLSRLTTVCLTFISLSGVALLVYVWPTPRRIRNWLKR